MLSEAWRSIVKPASLMRLLRLGQRTQRRVLVQNPLGFRRVAGACTRLDAMVISSNLLQGFRLTNKHETCRRQSQGRAQAQLRDAKNTRRGAAEQLPFMFRRRLAYVYRGCGREHNVLRALVLLEDVHVGTIVAAWSDSIRIGRLLRTL